MKMILHFYHFDIIIKKTNQGKSYKVAYIHFNNWADTEFANSIKNKIISGEEIKIVYDFPWYWKVSVIKSRK